jgi:hypothetical protein
MNILTKNRILQQGDEYFEPKGSKGWTPVPKNDYGLQIQFTPYKEVRRPTETPFVHGGAPAIKAGPISRETAVTTRDSKSETEQPAKVATPTLPISPDNVALTTALPNVAKAEKGKTPAPTLSGAGEPHPASYLPTIVSKKAHLIGVGIKYDSGEIVKTLRETPETSNIATTEVAKSPVSPTPLAATVKAAYDGNGLVKIAFPKPDPTDLIAVSEQPIWTGRNGTFTGYGLEAMTVTSNIMLSPIGKRGVGNCAIQFPKAIIPELIDWLKKQTPK